ncbi:hypothetical protein H8K20_00510 [Neobittarella massiliensis]|uniref:Uncharacterized protein n=1 Tax=Neobittarella massiliensis (ex Bilen et al. 2018) TaxID=2041842 RepID=A0A8J6IJU8_9FIRM|nr:hypothetical protein [Neobittarella massiliensis]MBC3514874.1 hypothetical protein [Neobittarella massiliensis]
MKKLIKINIKLFLSSFVPVLGMTMLFAFINCMNVILITSQKRLFPMMKTNISSNIVIFIMLMFISYAYLSKIKVDAAEEVLKVESKGLVKHVAAQLVVLVTLLFIIYINCCLYAFCCTYFENALNTAIWIHILKVYFLDIFLIGLLGLSFGFLIALYCNRWNTYIVMLLVTIFFSPYIQTFLSSISSERLNLVRWADIFHIMIERTDMGGNIDYLYGIPNEMQRYNRILFWIGMVLLLCLLKFIKRKSKTSATAFLLLFTFVSVQGVGYIKGGNIQYFGYDNQRFFYNDEISTDSLYSENVFLNNNKFSVTDYTLKLNVGRQLSADVTVSLAPDRPIKNYVFVLYHGYAIKNIYDQDGKTVRYQRKGDYIEIENEGMQISNIRFTYTGGSEQFYSNYQGIRLLGFFPYYPIPQHEITRVRNQWMLTNSTTFKNYDLVLKHNTAEVVTNLGEVSEGHYQGYSDSLTIIGGLIQKQHIEGIDTDRPLVYKHLSDTYYGLDSDENRQVSPKVVVELLNSYCKKLGIPADYENASKVISLGGTGNSGFTGYLFADYMVVPMLESPAYTVIGMMDKKYFSDITDDKINLKDILLRYLQSNIQFQYRVRTKQADSLEMLFYKYVDNMGEDAALPDIYRYLCDPMDTRTPDEFLQL